MALSARGSADIARRFREIVLSEYSIQPVKNAYGDMDGSSPVPAGESGKLRSLVTSRHGAVSVRSREGIFRLYIEREGF